VFADYIAPLYAANISSHLVGSYGEGLGHDMSDCNLIIALLRAEHNIYVKSLTLVSWCILGTS
jgi:hypothetical protein